MIHSILATTVVLPVIAIPAMAIGSALIGATLLGITQKIVPVALNIFKKLAQKFNKQFFLIKIEALSLNLFSPSSRKVEPKVDQKPKPSKETVYVKENLKPIVIN